MKLLVKTKNILLLGMNGDVYEPHRPTLVRNDAFCQAKIAAGVVQVLHGNIPEEATDAEWLNYFLEADQDLELAFPAFLAKFEAPDDIKDDVAKIELAERLADAERRAALAVQLEAEENAKLEAEEKAQPEAVSEKKKAGK